MVLCILGDLPRNKKYHASQDWPEFIQVIENVEAAKVKRNYWK